MTITLTHEEAQQVLDALNSCDETWVYDGEDEQIVDQYDHKLVTNALETLRAKLSEPEPEPVAWIWDVYNGAGYSSKGIGFQQTDIPFAKHTPLYTAPPQRDETSAKAAEWVGLTDEEMTELYVEHKSIVASYSVEEFASAIEAKLKEKNA